MKTILDIAKLIQDKTGEFYKKSGETEVNVSFKLNINVVDMEIVYPPHVSKLFSELHTLCTQLKFENHITEFNISISSSKFEVSLIQ